MVLLPWDPTPTRHTAELRTDLPEAIPRETLRALHRRSPWRHGMVAPVSSQSPRSRRGDCFVSSNPLVWVPPALVQGFTIFNVTILLHEVVHHTVFTRKRPLAARVLAFLHAVPSGMSPNQFSRWHLDHHDELGSDEDDPKRHHVSPKVNARWYKLLYCTPALFPIYFSVRMPPSGRSSSPSSSSSGLPSR